MRYVVYFILAFCFWLLLTLSVNIDHLIAGAIVVLLSTIIFGGYFTNIGGMPMPLVLEFSFADGSKEIKRVPAQIWARNNQELSKVFWFPVRVTGVLLDPNRETADCDTGNNSWPPAMEESRFEIYKRSTRRGSGNPMQEQN